MTILTDPFEIARKANWDWLFIDGVLSEDSYLDALERIGYSREAGKIEVRLLNISKSFKKNV